MNYSFMTFSTPELTWTEVLDVAEDYGYDGVEPRITANHAHGIEPGAGTQHLAAVRGEAADRGIAICCIATSCRYADPETLGENVATTKAAIELAAALACPRLRVFGGKMGEGLSREDAILQVSEALGNLGPHAAKHGVTLCLETHDDWTDPKHVAEVMRRANHPNVAVNWDIMHPVRQSNYSIDESYDLLQKWVRHMHVHDGTADVNKLVMLPIGEGDIDHKRAIERVHRDGYEGYISGEWINWQPWKIHLPRELQTMKRYEAMLD